jgi:uracil-DNA glycosylase
VPSRRERDLCADWLDRELLALRPPLIIPVGRLAIERFLGPAPLDEVVGRVIRIEHPGGEALAIALPHPSGASSWIHQGEHARLVDDALELLRKQFSELGIAADPARLPSPAVAARERRRA